MSKWRELGKDTLAILAASPRLTNRQVADLLGHDLNKVKETRRRHGIVYNKTPKDRGIAQKIADADSSVSSSELAKQLGCCVQYVNYIRRNLIKE